MAMTDWNDIAKKCVEVEYRPENHCPLPPPPPLPPPWRHHWALEQMIAPMSDIFMTKIGVIIVCFFVDR